MKASGLIVETQKKTRMKNLSKLIVNRNISLKDALHKMEQASQGLLLLTYDDGRFERTITDGDLRRLLLDGLSMEDTLETIASVSSHQIDESANKFIALEEMKRHSLNHLPVVDSNGQVVDVFYRKDLDTKILLSSPHMGSAERKFIEEAFDTNWIAPLGKCEAILRVN